MAAVRAPCGKAAGMPGMVPVPPGTMTEILGVQVIPDNDGIDEPGAAPAGAVISEPAVRAPTAVAAIRANNPRRRDNGVSFLTVNTAHIVIVKVSAP